MRVSRDALDARSASISASDIRMLPGTASSSPLLNQAPEMESPTASATESICAECGTAAEPAGCPPEAPWALRAS